MSGARVVRNNITPALQSLIKNMSEKDNIASVAGVARTVIINRTLAGLSLEGGAFKAYSKGPYYAPIANRPPGVPAPVGGRRVALRGGRKLKTAVFAGYAQYKAALGRGGKPQLSLTHEMLSSILYSVLSPRRAVLFFGTLTAANKASGLHEGKFPFFGLRDTERKDLYAALRRQLARKTKGLRPK